MWETSALGHKIEEILNSVNTAQKHEKQRKQKYWDTDILEKKHELIKSLMKTETMILETISKQPQTGKSNQTS